MNVDLYREYAAKFLNKSEADVSWEERSRMKTALFSFVYDERFLSKQSDYVRDAINREMREYELMEYIANLTEMMCDDCNSPLLPDIPNNNSYLFSCHYCGEKKQFSDLSMLL